MSVPVQDYELEVTYEVPDGDKNRTLRDWYPATHSYAWHNNQVDIYELVDGNHRPVASYSYSRVICVRRVKKEDQRREPVDLNSGKPGWPDPGQVLNPATGRPFEVLVDDGYKPLNLNFGTRL